MIPKRINRKIKYLLSIINSQYDPVWVPLQIESYAIINKCIPAVRKKIELNGGNLVLGWQIIQTKIITEAIFHSIWQSPTNKLIDITPIPFETKQTLFVQDDTLKYEERQIDNIRLNNTTNVVVDDFILVHQLCFKMANKNERANLSEVHFYGKDAVLFNYLQILIVNLKIFIDNGGQIDSLCFCESGKTYYKCHRDEIFTINDKI